MTSRISPEPRAALEIRTGGGAKWLGPDIWVVPGSDPLASPNRPIAGLPNYVWARVWHRRGIAVQGAQVRFYVSPPHTAPRRSTVKHVGTSVVDLEPGEHYEILCLTHWEPPLLIGGHCCIVAEVDHPDAPLRYPSTDEFHVGEDPQVAQRNVNPAFLPEVTSDVPYASLPIFVATRPSDPPHSQVRIRTQIRDQSLSEELLVSLGVSEPRASASALEFGLGSAPTCSPNDLGPNTLDVQMDPSDSMVLYLRARALKSKAGYSPVDIIETVAGVVVGGYTYILIT